MLKVSFTPSKDVSVSYSTRSKGQMTSDLFRGYSVSVTYYIPTRSQDTEMSVLEPLIEQKGLYSGCLVVCNSVSHPVQASIVAVYLFPLQSRAL